MMSNYFTTHDVELNQFYQLPKALIHDEKYKDLTANAKIAYAILQDRHSVSLKNGWVDKQDRVFFYFKDKDLAKVFDMTIKTAQRIKKQLKDYGLIEVEKRGLNQPSMIYLLKPSETSYIKDRTKMSYPEETKKSHPDGTKMSYPMSNTKKSNTKKSNTKNPSIHNERNTAKYKRGMDSVESTETKIDRMDVPMFIKKPLMMNKKRLIDDSIDLNDIENLFKDYKDELSAVEFGQIVGNVLENTRGKIKNIKKLINKSIMNHMKDVRMDDRPKEVLPKWFIEKKKEEEKRKESSYEQDYSGYDFTKVGNADWLP